MAQQDSKSTRQGGRRTVQGAVAQRQASDDQRKRVDEDVRAALPYIKAIVPSHVNAAQFVAAVIGLLHKNDDLMMAAVRNQPSFMAAMADCARLGLWPGDGYAFVPFKNRADEDGPPVAVTGIVEYTGEIQLMYNSGGVLAVIAEVVRQHDHFARGRHPHDPPEFAPLGEGFAADAERGPLIGAFAYAVLDTGQISRVVYMGRDEIMRHKAVAKTKKIWEGDFEPSMWLKTVIHELFKWVPKSAEYRREQMRAQSELAGTPLGQLTPVSPVQLPAANGPDVPGPPPRRAINGGSDPAPAATGGRTQRATRTQRADPQEGQGSLALGPLFDQVGIGDADTRVAYVKVLLSGTWDGQEPLTDEQTAGVAATLRKVIDGADQEHSAADLLNDICADLRARATADQG